MSASSVFGFDLGDCVCAVERMLVKTEEASSGIGSSGLVECERYGTIGLYGSGCSRSLEARVGTSDGQLLAPKNREMCIRAQKPIPLIRSPVNTNIYWMTSARLDADSSTLLPLSPLSMRDW